MSEEDREFLKQVFDSLVVDEVKRMKVIVGILQMPEDEVGLKRLLNESADALQKLQEVQTGRSEMEHHGGSNLSVPRSSNQRSASPTSPMKSPSPLPGDDPSMPARSLPVPTVSDYRNASLSELRAEVIRRKCGALEELDDRCLTYDNANDFMTIGGLDHLLICLLSEHPSINWRAAQALSTICQNNPKAQQRVFEHHALDYLLPLLTPPQQQQQPPPSSNSQAAAAEESQEVRDRWNVVVKALTALSALLRAEELPAIRQQFMQLNGMLPLLRLLQPPHASGSPTRVQVKVFTLVRHLIRWFPAAKNIIIQQGCLPTIIEHVGSSPDINHREACVHLLLEFAKPTGNQQDQLAAAELRKPQLGLKEKLLQRSRQLKAIKNKEDIAQAEDELNHTVALVKACKF